MDKVDVLYTPSQNLGLYIVSITCSGQNQKDNILKIGADS